ACAEQAQEKHELAEYSGKERCFYRSIGIFQALLSALFFSVQALFVNRVNDVNPLEITFFRMTVQAICIVPVVAYQKQSFIGEATDRWALLARAIFGTLSMSLMYYAIHHMPLGDASVLHFSSPVFVGLLACVLLKEACGIFEVVTTIFTLCGIVFIAQPHFIFRTNIKSAKYTESERLIASGCALGASACGAAVHISLRKLKHVHFSTVVFTYSVWGMIQSGILTYIIGAWTLPKSWRTWLELIGVGVTAVMAQTCFTKALQTENAGTVSLLRSMEIVFAFMWQLIIIYDFPHLFSIIGAAIISLCAVAQGVRKWINHNNTKSKSTPS
ncbi:solute carrier family 35 member G1-like, partial [Tubulanus polymorphus]|uniref:solute carrier family 35 member G1-like n=1 Tax=Tubulanus polymorphus TaxID=672921 RepID=UPI003DA48D22